MNEENKTKECSICLNLKTLNNFQKSGSTCRECKTRQDEKKIEIIIDLEGQCLIRCDECNIEKDYSSFYKVTWNDLGRTKCCKDCISADRTKEYRSKRKSNPKERECHACLKTYSVDFFKDKIGLTCKVCRQDKVDEEINIFIKNNKIPEKSCCKCGLIKSFESFYPDIWKLFGKGTSCKECLSLATKMSRDKINKRNRERRKTDPNSKIANNIRRRIILALKDFGGKRNKGTEEFLGCSVEECRAHLASKFLPGMTLENNSIDGWHIDHIIPCDSFDLTNLGEQKKCFHHTNLMPRWATTAIAKAHGSDQIGNINKGNKILSEYQNNSSTQVSVV